jgi:hypothetical protein
MALITRIIFLAMAGDDENRHYANGGQGIAIYYPGIKQPLFIYNPYLYRYGLSTGYLRVIYGLSTGHL